MQGNEERWKSLLQGEVDQQVVGIEMPRARQAVVLPVLFPGAAQVEAGLARPLGGSVWPAVPFQHSIRKLDSTAAWHACCMLRERPPAGSLMTSENSRIRT